MIETTARIRLPGPSVMLVVFNFLLALVGVLLGVLGMANVEADVRVETSLISKGPLVGLCIFVIIIDLMYIFTKFHLGKDIDKPLTFFLLVLKYTTAIFLLLALLRIYSLKSVIATTQETVCKHSTHYGSYFFNFSPVSLRHLGLDISMNGSGIARACDTLGKTWPNISVAMLGLVIALGAQVNFMLVAMFCYRQFKKDDLIVAPKKPSTAAAAARGGRGRRSRVKMVTKSDKLKGESDAQDFQRERKVRSEVSRMSRSKRTNHRRNNNARFSDSSYGKRVGGGRKSNDIERKKLLSMKVEDVSLDDISLSDIDRYV